MDYNIENYYINILKGIFVYNDEKNIFYPILNKNLYDNIKSLFIYLSNENNENIEKCLEIIFNIFKQSLDIAIIISTFSFCENKFNYNFLLLLIDLFMKTEKSNLQEIITNLFSFLFKNIEIKRNIYDYHLNNLLKEYKSSKLSSVRFIKYIKFLSILFGVNNDNETIEPRNYFYFNNNEKSGIEIPFPYTINLLLINGFSLNIFFNIEQFKNQNSKIIEIIASDNQNIIIYLNQNNELEITFNSISIKNLNIPIKNGIWNQLKFSLSNSKKNKNPEIHILLWENDLEKYSYYKKEILQNIKFNNDCEISSIKFFQNFLGKFTTIILYSIDNLSTNEENYPLKYKYGIYSKEQFIEFGKYNEKKNIYHPPITFIITPISFNSYNNLIIDPFTKMKGKFIKNEIININFNDVKIYRNSSKNIYKLGGINIFLPIFEMIYKSYQKDKNCFKEVILLISHIFDKKDKNVIDALKTYFFPLLSLFLEKFDDSLFDYVIIEKFIEIGKNIINLKHDYIDFPKEDYFNKILFNINLLLKYPPSLLNKFWELTFKNIQIFKDFFPNLTIFSYFLIEYYEYNILDKNLYEILKIIISSEKTKDFDRCNLMKICCFENISNDLIINIIDFFIYYFKSDCEFNQKQSSLIYFLKNNCLNQLIFILSNEDLSVKKKILEFMNQLNDYYFQIKEYLKNYQNNNNNKYKILGKKEFLELIKYNIIVNETNEKNKLLKLNSENNRNDQRRGSALINLVNVNLKISNIFTNKKNSCQNIVENNTYSDNQLIKQKSTKSESTPELVKIKKTDSDLNKNSYIDLIQLGNSNLSIYDNKEKIFSDSSFESNEESSNKSSIFNNENDEKNFLLTSKNSNVINFDFSKEKINNYNESRIKKKKSLSSKNLSKIIINKEDNNEEKKVKKMKKTKSNILRFNYFNLEIDTEKINKESELNLINFNHKVKSLAQHCVNYINEIDTKEDCNKQAFNFNNISSIKKNLNKELFDIIKEDENENCVSSRNEISNNLSSDNKNMKNINFHSDLKVNEDNININEEITLSPKNLNFDDLNNEEDIKYNLEDDYLEISNFICALLHPIKKDNTNINEINHYILDLIIIQCKKLKNLKIILNSLIFLTMNKLNVKTKENWKKDTRIYYENKEFYRFIIDIMFTCYLKNNISNFEFNLLGLVKNESKKDYSKCYSECLDLFIAMYFNNLDQSNSPNNMISYLFTYLLNFQNNETYNKKEKYNDYIYTFLRQIMTNIINEYSKILENTFPIFNKKSNQNLKSNKEIEWKNFFHFISLFFEYSMLFKNAKNITNVKSKFLEMNNNNISSIPIYIVNGIFLNSNEENMIWADYNNYKKIFCLIKKIWDKEKLFELCGIKNEKENNNNNVYYLSMNEINKLINYFIELNNIEQLQPVFEILFSSYMLKLKDKDDKNNEYLLPLINTISIQTVYLIELINDSNEDFIFWLNEYQFFIILILFASCYYKYKKKILDKYDYSTVCTYFYYNLAFNIGYIFLCFYKEKKNEIKNLYHIIIRNITRIFSKIIKLTEEKNNFLSSIFFKKKIEINEKSAIVLLNNDYIIRKNFKTLSVKVNNLNSKLLLNPNLNDNLQSNDIEKNYKTIFTKTDYNSDNYMSINYLEENKESIKSTLLNNKKILKYSKVLFNRQMYSNIYNYRFLCQKKINTIFNEENYFKYSSTYAINYKLLYENILIDNSNLKANKLNIEFNNFIEKLIIKKRLRKIKKELFSWNNTYSDYETFYVNYKTKLKYKLLYHLSKDLTNPLLIPILDLEYYFPTFSKYDKNNIFENNYRNFYNIDLKIFPRELPSFSKNEKDLFEFDCCYIKQTHHIKGKIKYDNLIVFIPNLTDQDIFKDKDEELVHEGNNCFGSIFKTNNNYKDLEFILQISIKNIILIFKRKYFYRDNSLEIFTSSYKSYYFRFKSEIKRDKFIKKLTENNSSFSEIKTLEKKIVGFYNINTIYKDALSSIDNISKKWKNFQISNLEYLMWLNIYSNRSYRDIHQYPIMPWPITLYLSEINGFPKQLFENIESNDINNYLIQNYKRDFNLPIGLFTISDDSIKRRELYLETFKTMLLDLNQEEKLNLNLNKIEDSEINENQIDSFKKNSFKTYGIDLELLYKNNNIGYEKIPYYFGSHFSNSLYTSHYLVRIFPYCLISIEIQVNNFDAPDRLFINLGNTFNSASTEKCDLRELIPEFFSLPEMFENINKLNLGYLQSFEEEINEKYRVENVDLPKWTNNNKNIFVMKMREILENEKLDINNWIDLIFGINQRGKNALKKGNIYYCYCYDGVMGPRIDLLKKNNQYSEIYCILSLYEIGVHPIKILKEEKKRSERKKNKKIEQQFNFICSSLNDGINKYYTKNPVFISLFNDKNNNLGIESLLILLDDFEKIKINFKDNNNCEIKSLSNIFNNSTKKYLYKKLIISSYRNNLFFLITGFINGNIIFLKLNENNYKETEKDIEIRTSNPIISKRDNSIITCLNIDNDEEFIYVGTEKGSIIIYKIIYPKISFFSMKNNHSEQINYINSNVRLNMFIDCSYDGFIHIYIMPKVQLVKSVYYKFNNCFIDYVFLSSSPLPSFVLHNNKNKFICYSINCDKLNEVNECFIQQNNIMISPIVFNGNDFFDYLIYGTGNNYILIRKFPFMSIIKQIQLEQNELVNNSLFFGNVKFKPIKFIQISKNKLFVYVIFDYSNKINVIPLNLE